MAFLNIGLDSEDRDVTRFFCFSKPSDSNSDFTQIIDAIPYYLVYMIAIKMNVILSKHLNTNTFDFKEKLTEGWYVDVPIIIVSAY